MILALVGVLLWFVMPAIRAMLPQTIGAVLLSAAIVAGIKFGVRRERPFGVESARWSAAAQHDIYSFPSGHAARVVCLAVCFGLRWPLAWPWLLLGAWAVMLARVMVGAHYWLDVMAGGLFGLGSAWLIDGIWPLLRLSFSQ